METTQFRYLRKINSLRIDVPQVFAWSPQLAVQGNFRECDNKGHLIVPGPAAWVDQWNNAHAPGETLQGRALALNGEFRGEKITLDKKNFILEHWLPNYILAELEVQDNGADVMTAECKFLGMKPPKTDKFADLLTFYKSHRKMAFATAGKQDCDETEAAQLAKYAEAHASLRNERQGITVVEVKDNIDEKTGKHKYKKPTKGKAARHVKERAQKQSERMKACWAEAKAKGLKFNKKEKSQTDIGSKDQATPLSEPLKETANAAV